MPTILLDRPKGLPTGGGGGGGGQQLLSLLIEYISFNVILLFYGVSLNGLPVTFQRGSTSKADTLTSSVVIAGDEMIYDMCSISILSNIDHSSQF